MLRATVGSLLLVSFWVGCTSTPVERAAALARDRDLGALTASLSDPDLAVRCAAARALAWLEDPGAIDGYHALLSLEGCEPVVRTEAAWRLAGLGHVDSVPAMTRLLEDPDPFVRWNVACALGVLGDSSADAALSACEADEDGFVAAWCAWGRCAIERGRTACDKPNMDLTKGPAPSAP